MNNRREFSCLSLNQLKTLTFFAVFVQADLNARTNTHACRTDRDVAAAALRLPWKDGTRAHVRVEALVERTASAKIFAAKLNFTHSQQKRIVCKVTRTLVFAYPNDRIDPTAKEHAEKMN